MRRRNRSRVKEWWKDTHGWSKQELNLTYPLRDRTFKGGDKRRARIAKGLI